MPDADVPAPERAAHWASVSRIAHHKGIDLSCAVAAAAGATPFTVAGHVWPGIDAYYALCVAKACRDGGFAYVPDAPDRVVADLLHTARGLLHLQRWLESFSIVVAEALCHGTPVLTTDQGAPQEWVRATDGGMVVRLSDLEAGRMEAAGVRDFFEQRWAGRREGIAKRARELFDVRRVADRYLGLYAEA